MLRSDGDVWKNGRVDGCFRPPHFLASTPESGYGIRYNRRVPEKISFSTGTDASYS
jgi:hypothetical protein